MSQWVASPTCHQSHPGQRQQRAAEAAGFAAMRVGGLLALYVVEPAGLNCTAADLGCGFLLLETVWLLQTVSSLAFQY